MPTPTDNQNGQQPVKTQEQFEQDVANKFDPEAFKADLMNSNKVFLESAITTMKGIVDTGISTMKSTIPQPTPTVGGKASVDSDIKEHVQALGLDEDGAAALTQIIHKVINKVAPEQESKILTKVDQGQDIKDKKALYENKIKTKFPQFYEPGSALFAQTKLEFNSMTEEERASPAAAYNAVTRAAIELGVAPAKIPNSESTFVDGNGKPARDPNKLSKDETDFASFFGVDQTKYKEARKGQMLN